MGCSSNRGFDQVKTSSELIEIIESENTVLLRYIEDELLKSDRLPDKPKMQRIQLFIKLTHNLVDILKSSKIRNINNFSKLLEKCYDRVGYDNDEEFRVNCKRAYNYLRRYPPIPIEESTN